MPTTKKCVCCGEEIKDGAYSYIERLIQYEDYGDDPPRDWPDGQFFFLMPLDELIRELAERGFAMGSRRWITVRSNQNADGSWSYCLALPLKQPG